jgi:hypothetical protein
MLGEINRLRQMSVAQLQAEWLRLYGEPSRSRNRDFLFRRLAWRVQELAHGGLSDRAKTRLEELAPDSFIRARVPASAPTLAHEAPSPRERVERRPVRDPRLPTPGTVITRTYRDRELRLTVLDDGFELDGARYGSLSEAARAVTGQHWNGRLFFGLTPRKRV